MNYFRELGRSYITFRYLGSTCSSKIISGSTRKYLKGAGYILGIIFREKGSTDPHPLLREPQYTSNELFDMLPCLLVGCSRYDNVGDQIARSHTFFK